MPQTATTIANLLKEVWTDSTIQKQYEADDGPLGRIEQIQPTIIGSQASVPIQGSLSSAGYTGVSTAGGVLNAAGNQSSLKASYTMVGDWFPIGLEASALNQATGDNVASIVSALDFEVEGALQSMRNQETRQLVTNGDGILAQCATTSSNATVNLLPSPSASAYGYDAIVRNWLTPNAQVDVGTLADTDSVVTGAQVIGITPSASAPAITLNQAISTTSGTHYVYFANPNSTTAANPEANGLRNIVSTGALGGLNPSVNGQEFWQPALRDTTTSVLSLDLMLSMARAVKQNSGQNFTDVWASLKQEYNYYSLLQNQVRFAGDQGLSAGNAEKPTWNGMRISGFNAILDSDLYFLTLKDLVRIAGKYKAPTWASSLQGANTGMIWNQGTTQFVDSLLHYWQVGARRRNTHAAATALVA